MATVSINTLKKWFVRGAKPTAEQFADLLDSYRHKSEELSVPAEITEQIKINTAEIGILKKDVDFASYASELALFDAKVTFDKTTNHALGIAIQNNSTLFTEVPNDKGIAYGLFWQALLPNKQTHNSTLDFPHLNGHLRKRNKWCIVTCADFSGMVNIATETERNLLCPIIDGIGCRQVGLNSAPIYTYVGQPANDSSAPFLKFKLGARGRKFLVKGGYNAGAAYKTGEYIAKVFNHANIRARLALCSFINRAGNNGYQYIINPQPVKTFEEYRLSVNEAENANDLVLKINRI